LKPAPRAARRTAAACTRLLMAGRKLFVEAGFALTGIAARGGVSR
jgi:hypothetical protein